MSALGSQRLGPFPEVRPDEGRGGEEFHTCNGLQGLTVKGLELLLLT